MKKILALVLALVMVLSMSAFAYADNIDAEGGSASDDITVTVTGANATTYVVTIDWTDMQFSFDSTGWNPGRHFYDGEWKDKSATVTVTNDSSVAIKAKADVDDADGADGITVNLTGDAERTVEIGKDTTYTLTPDGNPTQSNTGYTVATVTITIEKA